MHTSVYRRMLCTAMDKIVRHFISDHIRHHDILLNNTEGYLSYFRELFLLLFQCQSALNNKKLDTNKDKRKISN